MRNIPKILKKNREKEIGEAFRQKVAKIEALIENANLNSDRNRVKQLTLILEEMYKEYNLLYEGHHGNTVRTSYVGSKYRNYRNIPSNGVIRVYRG